MTAERATINEVTQIGIESTEGTAVAANRKLPSISITPAIDANVNTFAAQGNKIDTIAALGFEATKWDIASDAPTYDEIIYLLNCLLMHADPTQSGSTTAYTSTYAPLISGPDTVDTLTAESGSSVHAAKAAGLRVTDLELDWDRTKMTLKGSAYGRALSDGITLTSSPTAVAQVPMLPKDISIYADDTSGGLGGTKLLRSTKGNLKIGNRFGGVKVNDKAQTSYAASVELKVTATLQLTLEADTAGLGFLSTMRTNARKFVRVDILSDLMAGASIPYEFMLDMACNVTNLEKFSDDQGIYCVPVDFALMGDSGWGKWLNLAVTNTVAAL